MGRRGDAGAHVAGGGRAGGEGVVCGGVDGDVVGCRAVHSPLAVIAHEVLLVDAVPQGVGDASNDGAADLTGGHLAELIAGGVGVVSGVGCADEVGCILQRPWKSDVQVRISVKNMTTQKTARGYADGVGCILQGQVRTGVKNIVTKESAVRIQVALYKAASVNPEPLITIYISMNLSNLFLKRCWWSLCDY